MLRTISLYMGCFKSFNCFEKSYGSWFLGDYLCEDGRLSLSTPVDLVFIMLPIFEEARMKFSSNIIVIWGIATWMSKGINFAEIKFLQDLGSACGLPLAHACSFGEPVIWFRKGFYFHLWMRAKQGRRRRRRGRWRRTKRIQWLKMDYEDRGDTSIPSINVVNRSNTIYDFYGFPKPLYKEFLGWEMRATVLFVR
ncbi:uncharacterized protein LOC129293638 [Prosopis cineraria]|uniref:uncharacterized protein LOC129293638 n=1 Tax=Prosopis cineraria TaxID=364024 RepID=UPI00240ED3DB|nr:uncharacterized protein LOC129293638 [Prosopis cineraria]